MESDYVKGLFIHSLKRNTQFTIVFTDSPPPPPLILHSEDLICNRTF